MKTRAAVAWKAGEPLTIETIDIEGPKAGEVLVEVMATGICHTDAFTLSGADPEGLFPAILGHEGAGIVREVGAGVTSLKVGDHVIPLYTPECRQCKTCLSQRSNLCTSIRATQGKGLMPDGTSRFRCDGDPVFHYMGCSTFANFTVLPEIALAKVREDAPFDKICYIGCGVTTVIGAVMFAMLMGGMFLLPVFMQELLGFTATQSGMAMMPRVFVMMLATPLIGRIYNRVDPRVIIAAGVLFFSTGAWLMSHFTLETSQTGIIASIMVQGVGFSCLFVPLTTVALSKIPRDKVTDATGLNSLIRQIGGSIGLAIFTTMLSRYGVFARAGLSAHIDPTRPEVQARLHMAQAGLMHQGIDHVTAQTGSVLSVFGVVMKQSMLIAFEQLFLLTGITFLGILPILIFLKRPENVDPKQKIHVEIE